MFFIIKLGSVTNAQRGVKILTKGGYKAKLTRIERLKKSDGCGYAANVKGSDVDGALSLLNDYNIKVSGVDESGLS